MGIVVPSVDCPLVKYGHFQEPSFNFSLSMPPSVLYFTTNWAVVDLLCGVTAGAADCKVVRDLLTDRTLSG